MNKLIIENLKDVLSSKYLSYAVSTIISRSIPDLRDGLKPVHRRIIYSMFELNLKPESAFKKSARIVGDVMGKYHPHGDQAIYDSLVRMAQNFSSKFPLIEGQGNFGSIDGDNAAAMRYTEARLNNNANILLEGLDQNAVDFIDNYDGQNKEPSVLPASLPNILLNGSSGIAVGLSTNIPSHNIVEICNSLIEIIKNRNITTTKLFKIIKGPDLPTGGEIIINNENLQKIYSKGKGNFLIKSKWRRINLPKGQYHIEIYEIPYQVTKNRIIESIGSLIKNKKIPVDDIWDESDQNIRIIIKPKSKNIESNKLMNYLFSHTELSTKFYCNMNVLINGKIPKLLGLKDILLEFIDHRIKVIKRVSLYQIEKIKIRIELLNGFIIVYRNLDKIIKIIRNSENPKKVLMKKFKLKESQVNAILEMKLRSLRKIEEKQIIEELKKLKKKNIYLNKLIKNKKELDKYMIEKINKYLEQTDSLLLERKSTIKIDNDYNNSVTSKDEFNQVENITLVCSEKDNLKIYKGNLEKDSLSFNSSEKIKFSLNAKTNDKVIIFTDDGKVYTLNANIFPSGKSNGTNFSFFVNLSSASKIISINIYKENFKILLISKFGKGFIYSSNDLPTTQKKGKQIFNLKNNDKLLLTIYKIKEKIALLSTNKKLLIFNIKDIPMLKKSGGVLLQKIKDGSISDAQSFNLADGIKWKIRKKIIEEKSIKFWIGKRAQVGKNILKKYNKNLKFNL